MTNSTVKRPKQKPTKPRPDFPLYAHGCGKWAKTTAGVVSFGIYGPVELTVQGRECMSEVAEFPDQCPVLIGQIPLELLDFVVDTIGQRLIGNPDHGGEQMIEMI